MEHKDDRLGKTATDTVSGFVGKIIGVATYEHSPTQFLISSGKLDGNGRINEEWITAERVTIE